MNKANDNELALSIIISYTITVARAQDNQKMAGITFPSAKEIWEIMC